MSIRDPSEYLLPAVVGAINAADLQDEDQAMIRIARHLAQVVDQAPASRREYCARWVIPELIKALGCSPAARSRIKGGKDPVELDSPLKQLRSVPL